MGFPRFMSKRKTTPSCRFITGAIRLTDDRRHVTLPVLGAIKKDESTRKPYRRLAGDLAITTLAVFSDGRTPVPNPKHYDTAPPRLGRLSRAVPRKQGPDCSGVRAALCLIERPGDSGDVRGICTEGPPSPWRLKNDGVAVCVWPRIPPLRCDVRTRACGAMKTHSS
jgi:hypothetical protein